MKTAVFAIYDSKAEAYLQPFFSQNKATAIRALLQALGDPNSNFCKYPADYTLFEIANFTDNDAILVDKTTHENLGNLLVIKTNGEHENE